MSVASGSKAVGELVKKHAAGKFIKLAADGDSVVIAFVGDEYAFETVWTGGRTEFYDPDKHKNLDPSLKITWNAFVPATGKMMIFPCNSTTYQKIIQCRDKYGLDRKLFEIKRQGAKGDTNTTYSVMPDADLTKQERADIDKLDRFDLAKEARSGGKGDSDSGSGGDSDSGSGGELISEEKAQALIATLKGLPRDKLDAFLSKFGVERVRELDANQVAEAEAFVAELSGNGASERDPFA
jgi:hypothetical protein